MSESEISNANTLPAPKKGIARIIAAVKYSLAGIGAAFKREEAFRIEIALFILLTPVGIWLGETAT
jgi:diacylglycerol kinase (ATP)